MKQNDLKTNEKRWNYWEREREGRKVKEKKNERVIQLPCLAALQVMQAELDDSEKAMGLRKKKGEEWEKWEQKEEPNKEATVGKGVNNQPYIGTI